MILNRLDPEILRRGILGCGAVAVGFASAAEVEAEVMSRYRRWIGEGNAAGMDYLARHAILKVHPRSVLEDVSTVISVAFSYAPGRRRDPSLPHIACYAYGLDYHDVLRSRLSPVVDSLKTEHGGSWRICIDSAPIPERYWAMRCGVATRCRNGSVAVDGFGTYIFLAEILTSLEIAPDEPTEGVCAECGACVRSCPQNAIAKDGTVDARRCINYLTIEHRGDWEGEMKGYMSTPAARHSLFGCDICQDVCPLNRGIPPSGIDEFQSREGILSLTAEDVAAMDREEFSRFFKGSPIKRGRYEGLLRNAKNCLFG